jgi:hypothetical protein
MGPFAIGSSGALNERDGQKPDRRMSMESVPPSNLLSMKADASVKLIRKLRWIGLDEDARRLELAVRTLPPGEQTAVSEGPFEAD